VHARNIQEIYFGKILRVLIQSLQEVLHSKDLLLLKPLAVNPIFGNFFQTMHRIIELRKVSLFIDCEKEKGEISKQ